MVQSVVKKVLMGRRSTRLTEETTEEKASEGRSDSRWHLCRGRQVVKVRDGALLDNAMGLVRKEKGSAVFS